MKKSVPKGSSAAQPASAGTAQRSGNPAQGTLAMARSSAEQPTTEPRIVSDGHVYTSDVYEDYIVLPKEELRPAAVLPTKTDGAPLRMFKGCHDCNQGFLCIKDLAKHCAASIHLPKEDFRVAVMICE